MHQSENDKPLQVEMIEGKISDIKPKSRGVEFIILHHYKYLEEIHQKEKLYLELNKFLSSTDENATIAILTSPIVAADFCSQLSNDIHLKLWITVKLENPIVNERYLEEEHTALLILTRYKESLKHTKTRIGYTYCPYCDKTTKDYGGKKHLYHEFGTLMSDVWRDMTVNLEEYPQEMVNRLADLFAISEYDKLNIYDQRNFYKPLNEKHKFLIFPYEENHYADNSILLNGDCIEQLRTIPDNSIDFCFADPPYNLKKKYENWNDGIDIQEYFEWCDQWLSELARVLKPGRTLAVLNLPQWNIRHFKHLNTILDYQDWIVWEGLSMPVRMIMPAHYSILCFSKGEPRNLPVIERNIHSDLEQQANHTLKEHYCLRSSCVKKRKQSNIQDSEFVSNLWHDVHRLKHNSRRVDHPCQLPPMFMHRLISLFTHEQEFILDPFNGAGTTTLAAQQLNRKYVGIELSDYYHDITTQRHLELSNGLDPFRKNNDDKPKAKNSPVERLKKQKYEVSKKVLQLEIKNLSENLGYIPTKEEVKEISQFPIEYFENYFTSWGEATAAARTTGMKENRVT
ncbi:DNA methyltransferase [Chryseobacterium cucumeris]|uniref:DNA methyltransferase n=1 Tax=Chryseobacterium cucumeris TaxID=1813611 RepID=UPI001F4A6308|nr:DNA methyltransferase [Chryseobacterium cucumeris]